MTIKELLRWGHEQLLLSSSSARLDAELPLAYVLGQPVTFLLAHDETSVDWFTRWKYKRLIAKRKAHWPVAYLTGHKEFYFLDYEVNRHVLVPRPDTEILVEAVIEYIQGNSPILLDIGTGSGCIAISILKNIPELTAVATDISRAALRVARRNAKRHGVYERIEFIKSDLLRGVPLERLQKQEVIVTANLPYVPKDFSVNPETQFEPQASLYGGGDGVEVYKRLMEELRPLCPRAIFLECFDFQKAVLAEHFKGYELRRTERMTGQARLLFLERNP